MFSGIAQYAYELSCDSFVFFHELNRKKSFLIKKLSYEYQYLKSWDRKTELVYNKRTGISLDVAARVLPACLWPEYRDSIGSLMGSSI